MRRFTLAATAFCAATAVYAADAKIGNLSIDDVWARNGQAGQVSAAFMKSRTKALPINSFQPTAIAPRPLNCTP